MSQVFTRDEVAKHNTPGDAWVIVDGDVYDVTKFAKLHPGGMGTLLDFAGQDVTEDFYGLHRNEVLDKYKRLKKGRVADAGPTRITSEEARGEVSKVPYAEPAHLQGMSSPYFKDSHINLRKAVRKFFAHEDFMEDALECEATARAPSKELRQRMGEAGIIAMVQGPGDHLKYAPNGLMGGVVQPKEFDYFHELVVQEERSRLFCPGWEDGIDGACSIGVPVIIKYGAEWMKEETLPSLFKGDTTCALAISEAYAGSDVAALRSRAVLDAKQENYIVNGTKKWITGGMYADWFVTAVRTGAAGAKGISMLLVPRSDAVQTTIIKSKYSSAAGTAFVTYENAAVPKKNLFKKEGQGFPIIMSNFNHERWMICVVCAGRARLCTEEVFKWAMQRKVFGNKLVEQPVIREKLAQMFAGLEQTTSMCYDVTHAMNLMGPQSAEIGGRIALLKYSVTRMCHLVADNAVQILGGRGVTIGGMGRIVETFHRVYKVPSVYGGSEEIMADLAVRQAIKAYPQLAKL
jgi:alkylation response protein AidB-like acyl-CoA dehydrogenase/predicted heme/steroid binding protein